MMHGSFARAQTSGRGPLLHGARAPLGNQYVNRPHRTAVRAREDGEIDLLEKEGTTPWAAEIAYIYTWMQSVKFFCLIKLMLAGNEK